MKPVRMLTKRILLSTLAFLVCLLTVCLFSLYHSPAAHADTGGGCTASGGATCQEIFAVGNNTPLDNIYNGPDSSFLETIVRGYLYSNTGDNERYMIYVISVTLDPGPNGLLSNLVTKGPDTSQNGAASTIQVRLWSTNNRSGCTNTPCTQMNYSSLEQPNFCQPNGGSASWSLQDTLSHGIQIGWSVSVPTYNWCTYIPSTDVWSQYNNYTLQDKTQSQARITQQFVFAQWEENGCCGRLFEIGFSVKTQLYETGPGIPVAGPGSGNNFAAFAY